MTAVPVAALRDLRGRAALEVVWSLLPDARLVGGVVRDLLAARPASDLDLATPLPPPRVMALLRGSGIRVVPTGLAHGTVTAIVDDVPVEITTLRRDLETDGRHAVVAWTDDWREDAARRDFTINAMSLGRDAVLHDYHGGAADLAAGLVRFVGDPAARIAEDVLRVLRFFRFQARFGRADPDPAAIAAIAGSVAALDGLSGERVWSELGRLLEGEGAPAQLQTMQRLGVLDRLLPGGADAERLFPLAATTAPPDRLLRLAAIANGPPDALAERLRLSNAEAARLDFLRAAAPLRPDLDDAALRRRLAVHPAAPLAARSWLDQCADPAADPAAWDRLRARLFAEPPPVFPLSGRDALAAGLPPGPAVGRALRMVQDWWRDTGCIADRAACLDRLAAAAAAAG